MQQSSVENSSPSTGNGASEALETEITKQNKSSFERKQLLENEESALRKKVASGCRGNRFIFAITNGYSAVMVFVFYLISLESLLSIGLSAYLTIYAFRKIEDNDSFDGSTMNWVLLSFAVITPMSRSIGFAFSRRETALGHLAVIKSTLLSIYSSHACWDWATSKNEGRNSQSFDSLKHTDKLLDTSIQICSEMTRLLTLPSCTRARHRVLSAGKSEAKEIENVMNELHLCILERMAVITDLCEDLKYQGLPPNEATRIRQWERMLVEKIEMLLVIKKYRTPQALRSFARLFTVFLPPFYCPFYAQLAKDLDSLPFAIAFSVLTSIALTSLFESISQIEDPFTGKVALDGIDVGKELRDNFREQLFCCRLYHFGAKAKPFQSVQEDTTKNDYETMEG